MTCGCERMLTIHVACAESYGVVCEFKSAFVCVLLGCAHDGCMRACV